MSIDNLSLAHTCWNCKYHIVFAPKYRRKVFFGNKRIEIGKILRKLCEFKGITIIEAEICLDHVHMLIEIPPKLSVSGVVGFLKGKSSLMIYERRGNMKFKYRNRQFWCRGFYVDTVRKNTAKIKAYIQNQLKEDEEIVQLNIEFHDEPLMGSR
ncbi:MAG: IS200/IS605 family transposase [Erysipelotrichaceae bacterium]|nr:IS200/IS605 family transposase [Erysipelotrichaceae bacterium]